MAWFKRQDDRPALPHLQDDPEDAPARLALRVADTVRLVNKQAGQLPTVAVVKARVLTDTLRQIVETSAVRELDVYAVLSLRGTLDDYLPTTLRRYLAVPEEQRNVPRAGGVTPTSSLLDQLDALQNAASLVLTASQNQDVDALMTQGSFLATKFSRSDLDL